MGVQIIITKAAQDAVASRMMNFEPHGMGGHITVKEIYPYLPEAEKSRRRKIARSILSEALSHIKVRSYCGVPPKRRGRVKVK